MSVFNLNNIGKAYDADATAEENVLSIKEPFVGQTFFDDELPRNKVILDGVLQLKRQNSKYGYIEIIGSHLDSNSDRLTRYESKKIFTSTGGFDILTGYIDGNLDKPKSVHFDSQSMSPLWGAGAETPTTSPDYAANRMQLGHTDRRWSHIYGHDLTITRGIDATSAAISGTVTAGATTVSSLTTNTINSDGNQEIQVNADLACNSAFRTTKISPRTGTVIDVDAGLDVEGPIVSESKNNVIPGLYFGTAGFTAGLIQQETISVGTSWVNVPHTGQRGAYLILASGIANDDSALVAAVSDDSQHVSGHINILTRHGDYYTNDKLLLQYATTSNVQIRMEAGNSRYVSIVVIRAGGV